MLAEELPLIVGLLSLAVVLVTVVCVCRGRLDLELESEGHIDAVTAVELSSPNK